MVTRETALPAEGGQDLMRWQILVITTKDVRSLISEVVLVEYLLCICLRLRTKEIVKSIAVSLYLLLIFFSLSLLFFEIQELLVGIVDYCVPSNIVIVNFLEIPHELFILIHPVVGLELELRLLELKAVRLLNMVVPLLLPHFFQSVEIVNLLLQLVPPHLFDLLLSVVLGNDAAVRHDRGSLAVVAITSIAEYVLKAVEMNLSLEVIGLIK